MLAKLLATICRRRSDKVLTEQQPAALPPEALQLMPMVPLRPPQPHNDDGMRQVREHVEQALRASGHLR